MMDNLLRELAKAPWALVFCIMALLGWAFVMSSKKLILNMIRDSGFVGPNYRKQDIPVAAGMLLSLPTALVAGLSVPLKLSSPDVLSAYLLLVMGFGAVGLVDDLMGSRDRSGLAGHLRTLFKEGKLTTGALKALYGGLISVAASWILGGSLLTVLVRALVFAFTSNLINLLDLRPGRAIKGFAVIWLTAAVGLILPSVSFSHSGSDPMVIIAGLLGAVLAYAPSDFKAKSMMGDSGSNVLGAALGFFIALCSIHAGGIWLWVWLGILAIIHFYSERRSITKLIEANPVLKAIDELGRGGE